MPAATVAQRIVRAKRKIRLAGVPLSVPENLTHRLPEVLSVIYLVFNAGYLGHGPDDAVRVDLADEAVRLARLLHRLLPSETEVAGLLALVLYHRARFDARLDAAGDWFCSTIRTGRAGTAAAIAEADRLSTMPSPECGQVSTKCRRSSRATTRTLRPHTTRTGRPSPSSTRSWSR